MAIYSIPEKENACCQQDYASPHYAADVREDNNQVFHKRWIGRLGLIEKFSSTPDLHLLDFY